MKDSTTDRELLELAAKAAGLALNGEHSWRGVALQDGPHNYWNPLTDDGDALRLAVKLRMEVGFALLPVEMMVIVNGDADHLDPDVSEIDLLVATRRAIVRAAAEIGRSHHA